MYIITWSTNKLTSTPQAPALISQKGRKPSYMGIPSTFGHQIPRAHLHLPLCLSPAFCSQEELLHQKAISLPVPIPGSPSHQSSGLLIASPSLSFPSARTYSSICHLKNNRAAMHTLTHPFLHPHSFFFIFLEAEFFENVAALTSTSLPPFHTRTPCSLLVRSPASS